MDADNGHFDNDLNSHVPNHSGEPIDNATKASSLDDETTASSLFPVNNLLQCTSTHQKALEDKPVSVVCRINQEEATILRTDLGLEVGSKERGTSQGYAVAQKIRLDAFDDYSRHGGFNVKSQKRMVHTGIMSKHYYVRSRLSNTMNFVGILVQSNIAHSLDLVMR